MKERPILFSAPMVRAILEGRKTQTRRVIRSQPIRDHRYVGGAYIERRPGRTDGGKNRTAVDAPIGFLEELCPYGCRGDRLWVRETHLLDPTIDGSWPSVGDGFASIEDIPARYRNAKHVLYRADNNLSGEWRWRPSIHMPRWASRITLEITDVRVERVQGISEEDAIAEGCDAAQGLRGDDDLMVHVIQGVRGFGSSFPVARFVLLWDSINGKRGFNWNANPYVWVITFKRVTP